MNGPPERIVLLGAEFVTQVKTAFEISFQMTDKLLPGDLALRLQHVQLDMAQRGIEFTSWSWDTRKGVSCLCISGRGWARKEVT